MLSCHLPGGTQIGRMSLPKLLSFIKRETFLFWCSISFWNILQGLVLLFMFFFLMSCVFLFLYLLWDPGATGRMGNSRGCSLEFPAGCRVRLRACPCPPSSSACSPSPARPLLSVVACVCTCMRGLDVWESL